MKVSDTVFAPFAKDRCDGFKGMKAGGVKAEDGGGGANAEETREPILRMGLDGAWRSSGAYYTGGTVRSAGFAAGFGVAVGEGVGTWIRILEAAGHVGGGVAGGGCDGVIVGCFIEVVICVGNVSLGVRGKRWTVVTYHLRSLAEDSWCLCPPAC